MACRGRKVKTRSCLLPKQQGHHQVNRQAGLDADRMAQLPGLDFAAALGGAMKHFDAPASGVPFQLLTGLREALHRQRRQQPPFHGLDPGGSSRLSRPDCPQAHIGQFAAELGRPQFHRAEAHFQLCRPCGPTGSPRQAHLLDASHSQIRRDKSPPL